MGVGGAPLEEPFAWVGTNDMDIPLSYFFGVLNYPEVEKVILRKPNGVQTAKIISLEEGLRIWFAFLDNPFNQKYPFVGLDHNGKEIFNY
jgi:hypothetical protein